MNSEITGMDPTKPVFVVLTGENYCFIKKKMDNKKKSEQLKEEVSG